MLVPAVVYGHGEETQSLAISKDAFGKAIRLGARVVDLKQSAGVQKVLIREVQWDAIGHDILHVDFARVAADERITLDIRGRAAWHRHRHDAAGGVVVQPIHNLSVECLAISVPESIRVNVGELMIGQSIHVKDLVLPEGLVVKNDPDAIIVQVIQQAAEDPAAAVPGAVAAEQAEPELIGKKKAEEGEETEE